MMDRRRVSSSIAGLLIAVAIAWFFTCQNSPRRTGTSGKAPPADKDREARGDGSGAKELNKFAPVPLSPSAAVSIKFCRELLARGLLSRNMRMGTLALDLGNLHRGNREFIELADAFCKQAGDDLVPICRNILGELKSDASSALVAAILGHSRRAEAFDVLKELAQKGQGPPVSQELFGGAVYSIGMIQSAESAPFLIKLFKETPGSAENVGTKFGTALMAAIGMCGRDGVAILREAALSHLDPEIQVDASEGLRPFRWSYLSLVSSPEAFDDLKNIADRDSDIRLRGMAIAAMGQSPHAEQRAYLADLYARDPSPEIKRAIVQALHDGLQVSPDEWLGMKERMAGPLASILKATRVPSGDEYLDYAAIFLASASGTPEGKSFVKEWLRAAQAGSYSASEIEWIDIAVHALGAQRATAEQVDALLAGREIPRRDRVFYLASLQNQSASPIGGLAVARELIDDVDKATGLDGTLLNCLQALGKMPEAREELGACLDRLMARGQGIWGLNVIHAAESAGDAGLRPLEKMIRTSAELPEVLQASNAYLRVLPEKAELGPELHERMKSLFSGPAIKSIQNGALSTHYESPGAFARTVGLYFGRYGTAQDVAWLETLPRLMNDSQIREDYLVRFRQELAWECARAADAIRLRSN